MQTSKCLIYKGLKAHIPLVKDVRTYHATTSLHKSQNITANEHNLDSLYIDTVPPSAHEIQAAKGFFQVHVPTKSWTATEWRKIGATDSASGTLIPEVVFLGRSNSGKSSLLNAILGDPGLCRVGAKPGKTTLMHAWSLAAIDPSGRGARKGYADNSAPKLNVLDTPGFGYGSHSEWGEQIMKYLSSRRQLRRAFVLVNPFHGLKDSEFQILRLLKTQGIPHQIIGCKCDGHASLEVRQRLDEIRLQLEKHFGGSKQAPVLMTINDILAVGGLGDGKRNQKLNARKMQGVHDVQWAILRATGLEEYALSMLPSRQRTKLQIAEQAPHLLSESETASHHKGRSVAVPVSSAAQVDIPPTRIEKPVAEGAPEPLVHSQKIGIGIEELMAMTIPSISLDTSSDRSTTPTRTLRPRRQRMAASRRNR